MEKMLDTPVLFLIFNRPDVTQKVFDEIKKAKPLQLFVAADGPRSDKHDDIEKCRQTREIIAQVDWNCEVKTLFRDENIGLRKNITSALNWFFENVEKGIILEDDCLPDLSFFTFCRELLNYYENDSKIMHIAGTNFQDGNIRGDGSYYFSRISAQCWGWATWRRAWKLNKPDMIDFEYFESNNLIANLFEYENFNKFWLNYYKMAFNGFSSWNAVWSYSVVSNGGLCVIPNNNLVSNIGFREDSVHCINPLDPLANIPSSEINNVIHPSFIIPSKDADYYIAEKYFNISTKSTNKNIFSKIFKLNNE